MDIKTLKDLENLRKYNLKENPDMPSPLSNKGEFEKINLIELASLYSR